MEKFNKKTFNLKRILFIYDRMFLKYQKPDCIYYLITSMIIHFYNENSNCIIAEEKLEEYFEKNLFPASEDEDVTSRYYEEFELDIAIKFYNLIHVLQLLATQDDNLIYDYEYCKETGSYLAFQKTIFTFQKTALPDDSDSEKIYENNFFDIETSPGIETHFYGATDGIALPLLSTEKPFLYSIEYVDNNYFFKFKNVDNIYHCKENERKYKKLLKNIHTEDK